MTGETVLVPGARRAVGTLYGSTGGSDACVVACPPHPQSGGHRRDTRLAAVSDALGERGIACLRLGYGGWDRGYGEREDARNALRWIRDRYDTVGLFGYSFGASIAALAAAGVDPCPAAVALLAPIAGVEADDLDVVPAVEALDAPLCLVVGAQDTTANWWPVVAAAESAGATAEPDGATVTTLDADHGFADHVDEIAAAIASFLAAELRA
ncbi:alpha/beta hydrolase [Halarchaeum salinum]|uniref:Alpha/beta hydrolase n=1 Tax=Halarchaeum salinum TaxID=489912 RepID=A0AAV3S9U8_9EURY